MVKFGFLLGGSINIPGQTMSLLASTPIRYVFMCVFSMFLVSGCSSSGSSNNDAGTPHTENIMVGENSPIVDNSISHSSVLVDFEITVPTYQSNQLQVRLKWGDTDIAANWIGDEFWSITTEFPINTEHLLSVTFFDRNGAIILGSYETSYLTGTNASEILIIGAEDFVTETFDNDNDGVSNLAESIAGTDPLIENTAILEVRESVDAISLPRRVNRLESLIPDERPYVENFVDQQPQVYVFTEDSTTIEQNIDLDEFGSGSISYSRSFIGAGRSSDQLVEISGTRSNQDSAISWLGTYTLNSNSALLSESEEFNITNTIINDRIRAQKGVVESLQKLPNVLRVTASFELSGEIIDGSNLCSPNSGFINISVFDSQDSIDSNIPNTRRSISKESDDEYWTIRSVEEYWVESIGDFYCEFKDQ